MTILREEEIDRIIRRLAVQAVELNGGVKDMAIIGIRTRGVVLAQRLKKLIDESEGTDVPLGILDIALYRDDLMSADCDAVYKGSEIAFPVEGKNIVLCDDVLYTGRTVRAALSALAALGRARSIRLYCLVDRGHRELPFRADGVGKNIPTGQDEKIVVRFTETDGKDGVFLEKI